MSAVISDCRKYRYRLEREIWHTGQIFAFFGVNPSTADAEKNDSTTRKWAGFAQRNGARRYIVGNPFAFRATKVKEIAKAPDPIGPFNNFHITWIIEQADILIPCWGNTSKVPRHWRFAFDRLKLQILTSGKPVKIFGLTKSGDPMHPLMLGYDTPLIEWSE